MNCMIRAAALAAVLVLSACCNLGDRGCPHDAMTWDPSQVMAAAP